MGILNCKGNKYTPVDIIHACRLNPHNVEEETPCGALHRYDYDGSTSFNCGANASLSNPNSCALITTIEPGIILKAIITK
jgi:hypothetical protein